MSFSLDHLSETEFEEFCFDLLQELGFVNISWRKGTGFNSSPADQGRDLECERLIKDDIDGAVENEKWFVECKHYKKGVPPDKLSGSLAWANAETPDRLLIIASNFLSNAAKVNLAHYAQNNRPRFRIKTWERPDIERLAIGNDRLEKKYKIKRTDVTSPITIQQLSDPVFMDSIAKTINDSLLSSERIPLSELAPFDGSGLYAIYYEGECGLYDEFDQDFDKTPIYIGKAVGSNKSLHDNLSLYTSYLYRRLESHSRSIDAAKNLDRSEFSFQYSVMANIWAMLGEPRLVASLSPLWNVHITGFGMHDPGKGRVIVRSDWDMLHPGRKWAEERRYKN